MTLAICGARTGSWFDKKRGTVRGPMCQKDGGRVGSEGLNGRVYPQGSLSVRRCLMSWSYFICCLFRDRANPHTLPIAQCFCVPPTDDPTVFQQPLRPHRPPKLYEHTRHLVHLHLINHIYDPPSSTSFIFISFAQSHIPCPDKHDCNHLGDGVIAITSMMHVRRPLSRSYCWYIYSPFFSFYSSLLTLLLSSQVVSNLTLAFRGLRHDHDQAGTC